MAKNILMAGGGVGANGAADPHYPNRSLLLQGNGNSGQQNSTFLDSSSNNLAITTNGIPYQGTFSPFSAEPGKWGVSFDGATSYLEISNPSTTAFGTGNFTVEFWALCSRYPGESTAIIPFTCATYGTNNGFWIAYETAIPRIVIRSGNGEYILVSSIWMPSGSFHHVAICRNNGTLYLFLNGQSAGTIAWSVDCSVGVTRIGSPNDVVNSSYCWKGNISNLRIIKGTALYTSNFTPSTTPLTAVTGTVLLTCQDNRFKDNSTSPKTITPYGDAKIVPNSPFTPTLTDYYASVHGGSGYSDGYGYCNVPSLTFGAGDFTISTWLYPTTTVGSHQHTPFQSNVAMFTWHNLLYFWSSPGGNQGAFGTVVPYSWNYLEICRASGILYYFINGVLVGTSNNATNFGASSGRIFSNATTPWGTTIGYQSDTRILIGTALHTSNFTPPTAPATNTANTSLLCNFTNAGIIDTSRKNNLLTVGNAQVNTSTKKYGSGSMYFDGNGDYLQFPGIHIPINNNFTYEFWCYFLASPGNVATIFANGIIGTQNNDMYGFEIYGGKFGFFHVSYSGAHPIVISTNTPVTNTWTHYAITRYGNVTRLFTNGNLDSSATVSYGTTSSSGTYFIIGSSIFTARTINAYIDNFSIIHGKALYTSNFTPSTIPGYTP